VAGARCADDLRVGPTSGRQITVAGPAFTRRAARSRCGLTKRPMPVSGCARSNAAFVGLETRAVLGIRFRASWPLSWRLPAAPRFESGGGRDHGAGQPSVSRLTGMEALNVAPHRRRASSPMPRSNGRPRGDLGLGKHGQPRRMISSPGDAFA